MNSSKKVAHAVGGKTARACDSCIQKRARWYCAADDAFLCQACDSAVHSANQLAHRHKRVLLKTAESLKPSNKDGRASAVSETSTAPSWHRGFTRKARTPRGGKSMTHHGKSQDGVRNLFPQVPEVGGDDNNSYDEENKEDQQLLYRVPIFDPFVAELCNNSGNSNEDAVPNYEANSLITASDHVGSESKAVSSLPNLNGHGEFLLPSDMDLAEFAADVDSMLGRGLDDEECFGMERLGLIDCKKKESNGRVKLEEDDDQEGTDGVDFMGRQLGESEIDIMREPFVLNFEDYDDPPALCGEQDDKLRVRIDSNCSTEDHESEEADDHARDNSKKSKMILRLDYEAVITAWDGSPWTSGDRPEFDSECLTDYVGACGAELYYPYGDGLGVQPAMADGGREARVSRYREKRRTRLFSKKIRYEVRKLNAEKRPRMKGGLSRGHPLQDLLFPCLPNERPSGPVVESKSLPHSKLEFVYTITSM